MSRFEHEERVPSVVLAPAERYVVEVRFDRPGRYAIINAVQAINHFRGEFEPEVDTLGVVTVARTRREAGLRRAVHDAARQRSRHRATSTVSRVLRQAARQDSSRSP